MMAWPRDLDVFCSAGWQSETSEQFKDAVLRRCIVREYKRSDSVYRTGDDAGGLFGLVSGGLQLRSRQRIAILIPACSSKGRSNAAGIGKRRTANGNVGQDRDRNWP